MEEMLIWIPLLPALAALLCGLLGPKVLKQWSHWPALIAMGATFLLFIYAWTQVRQGAVFERDYWTWMAAGNLEISFGLKLDALSCAMGFVVSFVGLLIFIYSIGYMHGDSGYGRYFSYVSLFAAMMYTLILGNNLVVLFMGWEGVGLCSYLLIGFWYEDYEKASAAKKAFVVNRIGDAAFLVGMFILWRYAGTLNFTELAKDFPAMAAATALPIPLVALLLFGGATGKSAQIPLYTWLPDAMAGPTPVSALIHAATMVTAGIYMVTRCHFIFSAAPTIQTVIAVIGTATALVAAVIALTQNDIKKVLAYSTVSQLGYMFLALGCGAYVPAMFHLVTHAFFKACLFMISGNVIHAMHGEQDMQKMGGLRKDMPWSFYSCIISGMALAAIFPAAGFWSKDEILGAAFDRGGINSFLGVIGLIVGGLTAFYILRLICLTFLGKPRHHHHAHEAPGVMLWPVMILAFFSFTGGYFNILGLEPLHHFLSQVDAGGHGPHVEGPLAEVPHLAGAPLLLLMMVASAIALIAGWYAWQMYQKKPDMPEQMRRKAGWLYPLSYNKFYVDEIYDKTAVAGTRAASEKSVWFDLRIIDGTLDILRNLTVLIAEGLRLFQSGQVQMYAWWMAFGVVLIALLGFFFGGGA